MADYVFLHVLRWLNADCLTASGTKKRHILQRKQMAELFLVILCRQDIVSGYILKKKKKGMENCLRYNVEKSSFVERTTACFIQNW